MNYIIESFVVGIYSVILYLITCNFIKNIYLLLFLIGFFKHLFGFVFNIHTLYCNYGYACEKSYNRKYAIYSNKIWIESIIEGILYVFLGTILHKFIKNKIVVFFLIGVTLHIVFEILNFHKSFCKNRCV
jgi:hypothetical protein